MYYLFCYTLARPLSTANGIYFYRVYRGIFLTEKIIWTEYMALHFNIGCWRKLAFISLFTLKLFSHFAMGPG